MGKVVDVTGQRFGKLLVIRMIGLNKYGSMDWECLCDCGKKTKVSIQSLRSGNTRSCGNEACKEKKVKHGLARTGAYESYRAAKRRCNNPECEEYPYYGGRGIKFLWESPIDFVEDMGHRPEGMSLDRIDVDGNYCKENCRWADNDTQQFNKRATVWITWNGITQPLLKWCRELGLPDSTIYRRYNINGITDPEILFKPASPSMTRKRDNIIMITIDGVTKTLSRWIKILGLCPKTIYYRYNILGQRDPEILFRPTDRMINKLKKQE